MSSIILQGPRPVIGSEVLTVPTDAGGTHLTASKYIPADSDDPASEPKKAQKAFISVEDQAVRFSLDPAVAPDASTGHELGVNDTLTLESLTQIQNIRFIGLAGTATLQVTYFGN